MTNHLETNAKDRDFDCLLSTFRRQSITVAELELNLASAKSPTELTLLGQKIQFFKWNWFINSMIEKFVNKYKSCSKTISTKFVNQYSKIQVLCTFSQKYFKVFKRISMVPVSLKFRKPQKTSRYYQMQLIRTVWQVIYFLFGFINLSV